MSTDYRLEKDIDIDELFDGRLECFGIEELAVEGKTTVNTRFLTDGENRLSVIGDANGFLVTRFGTNNPNRILMAISRIFDTQIYSEYEPQFWGFSSQDEWDTYEVRDDR
jgi:hypothetical protein